MTPLASISSAMLERARLASKKISKTEAVQSVAEHRLDPDDIHVGPSDYVPWQNDNKICFLRMEGQLFGGVPMNVELRLSVEDSPNSAGVAIDLIRCARLAKDRGLGARSIQLPRHSASFRLGRYRMTRHSPSWSASFTLEGRFHRTQSTRSKGGSSGTAAALPDQRPYGVLNEPIFRLTR